jgi:hypothetical protein
MAAVALGWRPGEFWDSTPSELATALGLHDQPGEQIDRSTVEHLLSLFPDNRES